MSFLLADGENGLGNILGLLIRSPLSQTARVVSTIVNTSFETGMVVEGLARLSKTSISATSTLTIGPPRLKQATDAGYHIDARQRSAEMNNNVVSTQVRTRRSTSHTSLSDPS